MAYPKGKAKPAGAGRKKGTPNKTTSIVREAYELAFQGIGGVPRLIEWAKENPTEFYKLHAKLLPLQVTGEGGGALEFLVKVANDPGA